jgi:hypothetical protein
MAKIVRNVDDINKISESDNIVEIEYIEYVDDNGGTRRFSIKGLVPLSFNDCIKLYSDIDWSHSNMHFSVIQGETVE